LNGEPTCPPLLLPRAAITKVTANSRESASGSAFGACGTARSSITVQVGTVFQKHARLPLNLMRQAFYQ
jgi:hypothetical protein